MSQAKKTRTVVEIYGRKYTIIGDEDIHHTRVVASMVDEKMRDIYQNNKSLDTTRLAVLTAVNAVNDYVKLTEQYNELLQKIEEKEDY
ncbi:cell division protein ZapA [Amphibacillus marinus]|uniref:Cell division protein ZapA n=1 Tax=Amphibacillus marinus TaxID=872970 RepID=A0A1H8SR02_9BACI|nr:cell division protein ZapA [Amphibacillus marinus]SEO81389.1 cell division protein ZapA [Amphibacillus marinus]